MHVIDLMENNSSKHAELRHLSGVFWCHKPRPFGSASIQSTTDALVLHFFHYNNLFHLDIHHNMEEKLPIAFYIT